jgi:hypothetical protein
MFGGVDESLPDQSATGLRTPARGSPRTRQCWRAAARDHAGCRPSDLCRRIRGLCRLGGGQHLVLDAVGVQTNHETAQVPDGQFGAGGVGGVEGQVMERTAALVAA